MGGLHSGIRKYIRSIQNLGFLHLVWILILYFFLVIYPIIISYYQQNSFFISDNASITLSAILLVYSIIQIGNFIPQFFSISTSEYETIIDSENPGLELNQDVKIDYKIEKMSLSDFFISHGYSFGIENSIDFLGGTLFYRFDIDDSSEAWLHIMIENIKSDVITIRREIEIVAYNLFHLFKNSNSDINTFVLSFHIYIESNEHLNIFFRSTRNELNDISRKTTESKEFIAMIKNKLFDDLFRDL